MNHFALEDWVDYIRGVGAPEAVHQMRAHLEEGCPRCAGAVERLRAVGATMASGDQVEVPAGVVRRAYEIFQPGAVVAREEGLRRRLTELIFDSWTEPAVAGVRNTRDGTRLLSYRAGDLRIELSIETAPKRNAVSIAGQIHLDSGEKAALIPVQVMVEDRVVAESVTNDFGEFLLDVPPKEHMHLKISDWTRKIDVEVPLAYSYPRAARDPLKS